jgi:hypothetical protein
MAVMRIPFGLKSIKYSPLRSDNDWKSISFEERNTYQPTYYFCGLSNFNVDGLYVPLLQNGGCILNTQPIAANDAGLMESTQNHPQYWF